RSFSTPAWPLPSPNLPPRLTQHRPTLHQRPTPQSPHTPRPRTASNTAPIEADGTKRIVEYTAEDYGLNAKFKKEDTPSYCATVYKATPAYKPANFATAYPVPAYPAPAYKPAP
ncbi:Hypothetical protein CINCED_3A001650, partial [Cinara cedri]